MPAHILMYHRVCERTPSTACYFARGTAVTPETFERHLDELGARIRIESLPVALTRPDPDPVCALTFDDGYADIEAIVAPRCARRGISISIFPIARHLASARSAAWFDEYYDILHRAVRREGLTAREVGLEGGEEVPPLDADLRWWVRGPVKQRIARLAPAAQDQALDELAAALRIARDGRLAERLYLSEDGLRALATRGTTIGGHGATHRRLDTLFAEEAGVEIDESAALLAGLGVNEPRVFCYPDGGYSATTMELVARAGFEWALTVEPGPWREGGDPLRVPRELMRESTDLSLLFRDDGRTIA